MFSLRSELRRSVLTHFAAHRGHRAYVRRLAVTLEVDPTNLSRELAALERDGIFQAERDGRQLYYSLNRSNPHLKNFLAMLEETIGVEGTLRHALEGVPGVESALLCGDKSRPDPTSAGDLNLAVLGKPNRKLLAERIHRAELALGRKIKLVSSTTEELRGSQDPSLNNTMYHIRKVFPEEKPISGVK